MRRARKKSAFTLVELLVVIGIIALLIAILLPALNAARRQANATVCRSNLRQLATGLQIYVAEYKGGYIPGPNTSGLGLYRGQAYGGASASPVQDWDWISPTVGNMLKLVAAQSSAAADVEAARLQKYRDIMETKMRCPENETRYGNRFSGPALPGTGHPTITSYLSPSFFHFVTAGTGSTYKEEDAGSTAHFRLPPGYVPKISKVGPGAKKIFAFEGARYWDSGKNWFDYSTATSTPGLVGSPQGNFHSRGPATVGGSGEPYTFDTLVNGSPQASKPSASYRTASLRHRNKLQVVFFDGHTEELTFVDAADPTLWAPKGSVLTGAFYFNKYAQGTVMP